MKKLIFIFILLCASQSSAWTFGDSTYGTLRHNCEDTIRFVPYITPADSSGVIDSVRFRALSFGATRNWKAIIYDTLLNLLGTSDNLAVTSAPAAQDIYCVFSTKPEVSGSRKYYIAAWNEGDLTFGDVYGEDAGTHANDTTYWDDAAFNGAPNPVVKDGSVVAQIAVTVYVTSPSAAGQIIIIGGD